MALDFKDGFVNVQGHRLYYKTIGEPSKGTVLCLHGGPGGSHWTTINMADIAPFGYKVVWYDQLGCGNSEDLAKYSDYTIEKASDDVEGVRQGLGLGTCHLMGYSYGGCLALQTILRHPRGFRSLTIASGYASSSELYDEMMKLVAGLPPKIRHTIEEYEAQGRMDDPEYAKAAGYFMRKHVSDLKVVPYSVSISRSKANNELAKALMGDTDAITAPVTGTLATWDVRRDLRRIKVPTLVTVGARDHVTPGCAETIHRGIRGSKLVVFRKSGHNAIEKERDMFMQTMIDFLDTVSG
ncbi:MAG TPA: proline iminopeptidase-family hydrolase [Nitrososphaerales archaeon]|nr:proline iminopeptidase-family hydrolase [Nitrososphaerales archaeon]